MHISHQWIETLSKWLWRGSRRMRHEATSWGSTVTWGHIVEGAEETPVRYRGHSPLPVRPVGATACPYLSHRSQIWHPPWLTEERTASSPRAAWQGHLCAFPLLHSQPHIRDLFSQESGQGTDLDGNSPGPVMSIPNCWRHKLSLTWQKRRTLNKTRYKAIK